MAGAGGLFLGKSGARARENSSRAALGVIGSKKSAQPRQVAESLCKQMLHRAANRCKRPRILRDHLKRSRSHGKNGDKAKHDLGPFHLDLRASSLSLAAP